MRTLLVALILLGMAGCSMATWPDVCKLTDVKGQKMYLCHCQPSFREVILDHPEGKPKPAGRVVWLCGSEKLPVELLTDDVTVPQCQRKEGGK